MDGQAQIQTVDVTAYCPEQHVASSQLWIPSDRYVPPERALAPKTLVNAMFNKGTQMKALCPYRSLLSLVSQASLPTQIELGSYKLVRKARLHTTGLELNRTVTTIEQRVTVYGKSAQMMVGSSAHAPAGWNSELVLANGDPDVEALLRMLRHVTIPPESKLRLNAIESAWSSHNLYDNPVAMIFNGLRLYFKLCFMEATTKEDIILKAPKDEMLRWIDDNVDGPLTASSRWRNPAEARRGLEALLSVGIPNAGFAYHWGNPHAVRAHVEQIADGGQYEVAVTVYRVQPYEDGHARIEKVRFESAGFVAGRYLYVPLTWELAWAYAEEPPLDMFVTKAGPDYIKTLGATDTLNIYYVHAKGMTDTELALSLMMFLPSARTTPFLIDVDVPLPTDPKKLKFNRPNAQKFTSPQGITQILNRLRPTASAVLSVLFQLVKLNRWEEALFEAVKYILPYVAQPEPDTVEGHVWFEHSPTLYLPRLGLSRGMHAVFVADKPLALLHSPAQIMAHGVATVNAAVIQGPVARALYHWGEFLSLIGRGGELSEINSSIDEVLLDNTTRQNRVAVLLSGVSGMAEDSHPWGGTGIEIGAAEIRDLVRPGPLALDEISAGLGEQLDEAGVQTAPYGQYSAIVYPRPVPPSGLPFVVNMSGVLTQATPLAPSFTIEVKELHRMRRLVGYRQSWTELWRWTVAHRWLGYDVHYKLPEKNLGSVDFVGWCANYVSVCPPPPIMEVDDDGARYFVKQHTIQRDYAHSSPTEGLAPAGHRTFTWMVEDVYASETLRYRSPVSSYYLAGGVSNIVYSPSYADLFLGMTRVQLTVQPQGDQGFHVASTDVRPLGAGQIPTTHPERSEVTPDGVAAAQGEPGVTDVDV